MLRGPADVTHLGRPWALTRLVFGGSLLVVLAFTFLSGGRSRGLDPFDYFGYFTNLTSLIAGAVMIATGVLRFRRRRPPGWLLYARAIVTACMIVVGVIYNTLVPGTGSAPLWVSVTLHVAAPLLLVVDWTVLGDRPPLPWSKLWVALPFPVTWLIVTLIRGQVDGWVPYGFLLPSRGIPSLALHVIGLLGALLGAAVIVWGVSRTRGFVRPVDAATAPLDG